jgi:ubiquinol-cytochrome c reductase cytochrome c subunit
MERLMLVVALLASAAAAAATKEAEEGKRLYVKVGCYQCHGYAGQGGREGVKLAPDPLPYDALAAFVRGTTGAMPAYGPAILSDADLAKIHAYLRSVPPAPAADSLPLLKALR